MNVEFVRNIHGLTKQRLEKNVLKYSKGFYIDRTFITLLFSDSAMSSKHGRI